MASVSAAATTTQNVYGFLGDLYHYGRRPNTLLKLIGGSGMNELGEEVQVGAGWRRVFNREFVTNVDWTNPTPAQPARLEGANAPTANTFVPTQAKNVIQLFHEQTSVTYLAMSETGRITSSGVLSASGESELKYFGRYRTQLAGNLNKIANDFNYSALNGTYANPANPTSSALAMRGIIPAITTNVVAGGAALLTKKMLEDLHREMIDNAGVEPGRMLALCNTAQMARISTLYDNQFKDGGDRTVGGIQIRTVFTAFGVLDFVLEQDVAQDTIVFANPDVISGVYLPVEDEDGAIRPALYFELLEKVGSKTSGQIYGQLGIDYGPEWMHGKITGLDLNTGS